MTPTNQPESDKQHQVCACGWAIPPSPLMLKHGNDYYTCSVCGKKVEPTPDTPIEAQRPDTELRQRVVQWADRFNRHKDHMTTTEVDELLQLIAAECQEAEEQLLNKLIDGAMPATFNDGETRLAIPVASLVSERNRLASLRSASRKDAE